MGTPTAGCSATMLNSSWAITAAHCVYPLNTTSAATPAYAANQVTLSAAWIAGKQVAGLKLVIYDKFPYNTNDVALVQVPARSFDNPKLSETAMWNTALRKNDALTAFGRGINALAFAGLPDQ